MPRIQIFMKQVDKNCLEAFPEMIELYGNKILKEASDIGSYTFFEDYFNEFVEKYKCNDHMLSRVAKYIESIAQIDSQDIQDLTEIGILEGLVNREVYGIAKYLKPHSKKLLNQASSRINIDRRVWYLDRYRI